jgi:beta-glucanase (GH16 family)
MIMKFKHFVPVILLVSACSTTRKIADKSAAPTNPVVAHRGAWKAKSLPENSIAALKEAIRLGCAGSEFDVHRTADDSLVVNHDPYYFKDTIEKVSFATLAKHKLSNGERIPTLREYIAAGLQDNSSTRLVLEIKPSIINKERGQETAARAIKLVKEMRAAAITTYISFDYSILEKILSIDRKAPVQYLEANQPPSRLKADGIAGADYHYSAFRNHPEWISEAKKSGVILNAWTVNDSTNMDWLLAQGFDLITTNEPELLIERIKLSPAQKGWKLTWSDEFDYKGQPDTTRWNYDVGDHGWGNDEKQFYTKADTTNAIVKNGSLFITARKTGEGKYTSARLVTKGKGDWLYGRVEVRAKLPSGRGIWPAIWMLPTDWAYGGWPASGEIDIMEHVGYNPDSIFMTVHTTSFNHMINTQKSAGFVVADPYNTFHEYAIEWEREKIDFFMDGKLRFSFSRSGMNSAEWPFDKSFHLLLNIAVGGGWGGRQGVDENIFPQRMEVDYVRVYQK